MTTVYTLPERLRGIITEEDIRFARKILEDCTRATSSNGLPHPYIIPGVCPSQKNDYGDLCWSLDYALAAEGTMLFDKRAGHEFLVNMLAWQKDDGRVPLYTPDRFAGHPNITRPIGSLPKFMQTSFDAAVLSGDPEDCRMAYELIRKNLAWWFKNRLDRKTGLITAVFEETFIPNTEADAYIYAPMDTNIEVFLGCLHAASLAEKLGQSDAAAVYRKDANSILRAVRHYCYDEEDGFFYPYVIPKHERYKVRMASGFLGFYLNDPVISARLLSHLTNDAAFGWDTYPLTSVSKLDPLFTVTKGDYAFNASWQGCVWMLTNDAVIRALRFAALDDTADVLAVRTLRAFRSNCAEFLDPFTGKGYGMLHYAWTAGLFLRIVYGEFDH